LPERTSGGPAFRSLAAGSSPELPAVAAPSIVAPARCVAARASPVGATIGVADSWAFSLASPACSKPTRRTNASQRDAWKKKLDAVRAEDSARLRTTRLVVRAGPETIADRRSP